MHQGTWDAFAGLRIGVQQAPPGSCVRSMNGTSGVLHPRVLRRSQRGDFCSTRRSTAVSKEGPLKAKGKGSKRQDLISVLDVVNWGLYHRQRRSIDRSREVVRALLAAAKEERDQG
jgi:hypothetical protein